MNTYIVENARYYKCLMGDCPEPCCRWWTIQVGDDTYENYRRLGGMHGRLMRFFIKGKKEKSIRKVFGRCPFLVDHGLCRFQKDGGNRDLLPLVCAQFPFQVLDLGERREITMLLSCPATAAVFTDHPREISFIRTDEKYISYYITNNDDRPFLEALLRQRDEAVAAVCDETHDLPALFGAVYARAAASNARYLSNTMRETAGEVKLTLDPDEWGKYLVSPEPTNAFFPIELIDEIILGLIDYTTMSVRNTHFFMLIRRYKRIFGRLYQGEAEKWLDARLQELHAKDSGYADRHRYYFAYTLLQLYPYAYDTYFWQRQVLLAILYTELLEIFDVTEYISMGKVPDRRARILTLSSFEHGTRHNPAMTENIFNLIRRKFL